MIIFLKLQFNLYCIRIIIINLIGIIMSAITSVQVSSEWTHQPQGPRSVRGELIDILVEFVKNTSNPSLGPSETVREYLVHECNRVRGELVPHGYRRVNERNEQELIETPTRLSRCGLVQRGAPEHLIKFHDLIIRKVEAFYKTIPPRETMTDKQL